MCGCVSGCVFVFGFGVSPAGKARKAKKAKKAEKAQEVHETPQFPTPLPLLSERPTHCIQSHSEREQPLLPKHHPLPSAL